MSTRWDVMRTRSPPQLVEWWPLPRGARPHTMPFDMVEAPPARVPESGPGRWDGSIMGMCMVACKLRKSSHTTVASWPHALFIKLFLWIEVQRPTLQQQQQEEATQRRDAVVQRRGRRRCAFSPSSMHACHEGKLSQLATQVHSNVRVHSKGVQSPNRKHACTRPTCKKCYAVRWRTPKAPQSRARKRAHARSTCSARDLFRPSAGSRVVDVPQSTSAAMPLASWVALIG